MLIDKQCIVGYISGVPGSACTRPIIVQFMGQYRGTSPLMHRILAKMADI